MFVFGLSDFIFCAGAVNVLRNSDVFYDSFGKKWMFQKSGKQTHKI